MGTLEPIDTFLFHILMIWTVHECTSSYKRPDFNAEQGIHQALHTSARRPHCKTFFQQNIPQTAVFQSAILSLSFAACMRAYVCNPVVSTVSCTLSTRRSWPHPSFRSSSFFVFVSDPVPLCWNLSWVSPAVCENKKFLAYTHVNQAGQVLHEWFQVSQKVETRTPSGVDTRWLHASRSMDTAVMHTEYFFQKSGTFRRQNWNLLRGIDAGERQKRRANFPGGFVLQRNAPPPVLQNFKYFCMSPCFLPIHFSNPWRKEVPLFLPERFPKKHPIVFSACGVDWDTGPTRAPSWNIMPRAVFRGLTKFGGRAFMHAVCTKHKPDRDFTVPRKVNPKDVPSPQFPLSSFPWTRFPPGRAPCVWVCSKVCWLFGPPRTPSSSDVPCQTPVSESFPTAVSISLVVLMNVVMTLLCELPTPERKLVHRQEMVHFRQFWSVFWQARSEKWFVFANFGRCFNKHAVQKQEWFVPEFCLFPSTDPLSRSSPDYTSSQLVSLTAQSRR